MDVSLEDRTTMHLHVLFLFILSYLFLLDYICLFLVLCYLKWPNPKAYNLGGYFDYILIFFNWSYFVLIQYSIFGLFKDLLFVCIQITCFHQVVFWRVYWTKAHTSTAGRYYIIHLVFKCSRTLNYNFGLH